MSGYTFSSTMLENLCGEIVPKNKELIDKVLEKEDNILFSPEYIKYSFSKHFLEDINFLTTLSNNEIFKLRHAYMILRDMVEQIIEFSYLMKHSELISEFMGDRIDNSKISNDRIVRSSHILGSERYSNGRVSVSKMAKDIGEKRSANGEMTLYDIYEILSEECHNSYFFSNLDDIGVAHEMGEKQALTEEQINYLLIITKKFMDIYRS